MRFPEKCGRFDQLWYAVVYHRVSAMSMTWWIHPDVFANIFGLSFHTADAVRSLCSSATDLFP